MLHGRAVSVLDKVNAEKLALPIDHVVAFKLAYFVLFESAFEVTDSIFQVSVVHILCVPLGDFVKFKQVAKFHL